MCERGRGRGEGKRDYLVDSALNMESDVGLDPDIMT